MLPRFASCALALAMSASCSGTTSTSAAHATSPAEPGPPPGDDSQRPAPADEPASGRPYAETPITPLANELTELALAALRRQPLAPPSFPTAGPLPSPAPIAWRTPDRLRDPDALAVIGIAFELELVMKRGRPDPDVDGPERYGAIRVTLALSRGGLRVVGLRPRLLSSSYGAGTLPVALVPLQQVARELLASIRAEDITGYRLTDEDRALLDNETVWMQMVEDRVPAGRVHELAQMLATLPEEPIAYVIDDVAVLARDREANLYSLTMDFDLRRGTFAMQTQPLLEVRRLWPLSDPRSAR